MVQSSGKQSKVQQNACKEVCLGDNPLTTTERINVGVEVYYKMMISAIEFGLSMSVFYSLFVCYKYYREYGYGLNACEVNREHMYKGYAVSYISKRLTQLRDKGLLVVFGTGPNHSILYAPSERVIKLLDERFGSIEVGDGD